MPHVARPARTWIAGLAALALLASGAATVVTATAASATGATAVSDAQAAWGVKQSWRNYLAISGTITVADGVVRDGAAASAPYLWPSAADAGTYDEATRAGTIHLAGSVHYAYPSHFIDLTIANPTVILAGNGTGELLADLTYDYRGSGVAETNLDADQVKIADLTVPAPSTTVVGGTATEKFTGIGVTLNEAGAAAFADFYPAPAAVDPITLTFSHPTSRTTTATTVTVAPTSVHYGTARTAKVTVTPAGGGTAVGSVVLRDGAKALRTVTLVNGTATVALPTTLAVGRHTITAAYAGTAAFVGSTASATLTVTKAVPTLKAALAKKKITTSAKGKISVRATAPGVVPRGTVKVTKGKKTLRSATLSSAGKATLTLPKLAKGKYTLTVRYLGNANVTSATTKVTLRVVR